MKPVDPIEYFKYQVMNAPIARYPYPHFVIRDLFPADFYEELIKTMPDSEFAAAPLYPGRGVDDRPKTEIVEKFTAPGWKDLTDYLRSEEYTEMLLKKYGVTEKGRAHFYLHRDLETFEIRPHTDIIAKIATFLLYFAKDSSLSAQAGTYLLVAKEERLNFKSDDHFPWDRFKIVNYVPYTPNTMISFLPGDRSWHAVKIDAGAPVQRHLIRGFVFNPNKGLLPDYLLGKKTHLAPRYAWEPQLASDRAG